MSVSIDVAKNPVLRGDDQRILMSVSDATSNDTIPGAAINGKLLYPGGKFVRDFSGSTTSDGQFAYSWVIGKNGQSGEAIIQAQVTFTGYDPKSATRKFEISDN